MLLPLQNVFENKIKSYLRSSRAVSLSKRATSPSSDDSTTDDESESEDEQFTDLKTLQAQGDLPNEFWQVLIINCKYFLT